MRKQFWTILISMLILSAAVSQAQWRITTTQGNVYNGVITEQGNDFVKVRTLEDTELNLNRKIIESMAKIETVIQTKSGETFIGFISDLNEKELIVIPAGEKEIIIFRRNISQMEIAGNRKDSRDAYKNRRYMKTKKISPYSMAGATILMPGGVNLIYGYQDENYGIRLTAGYIGYAMGVQVNLLKNISKSASFEHNISLAFGTSRFEDTSYWYYNVFRWTYAGLCYDLNFHGFFLEAGLNVGTGSYSNPQVMAQIGYVYRFID